VSNEGRRTDYSSLGRYTVHYSTVRIYTEGWQEYADQRGEEVENGLCDEEMRVENRTWRKEGF
jgi:hypothetical protein